MRKGPFATLALVLTVGLGLTTSQPALASVSTKQVSVTPSGHDPARDSYHLAISSDGRYVVFASEAGDLVPGDHTIHIPDIFVRDVLTGTTVRASVDMEGGDPNASSRHPSISADGRFVAFESGASDLVAGDGNGYTDIFVRDMVAGTTARASVDTDGGDPNFYSSDPAISPDGRYVGFTSPATDLVPGDGNGFRDIFVRDMVAGTTVLASVDSGGGDANSASDSASLSADGHHVAFSSLASDLVPGDSNVFRDVFVRDLVAGTTGRASVDTEGADPNGGNSFPSLSDDGRYVSFTSGASDLVPGDVNTSGAIFVRDLVTETTVRASVDTSGGDTDESSFGSSISDDGRYVAFQSRASDLVEDDENELYDIFVRDLEGVVTVRVSVDRNGGDPNATSSDPSISADGRLVAFMSYASDLMVGQGDRKSDIFAARWS